MAHEQDYHKETAKCGKCGKTLRFPKSGLNHGMIAKAMGATLYCDPCTPPRGRMLQQMARLKSR